MSQVTNVILHVGLDAGGLGLIDNVNTRIRDGLSREQFLPVHNHAGGYKAFEADVYLCAFNYLDLDQLKLLLEKELATVAYQCWVMGQEDGLFRLMIGQDHP